MATVLLVEDDDDLRTLWGGILGGEGYRTVTAGDGAAAWEAYRRQAPGVVVTDLHIPRVHGLELIRRVHEFNPAVRIVAVSSDIPGLECAKAVGARIVLRKPLWPRELVAAVRLSLRDDERARPVPAVTPPGDRLADKVRAKLRAAQLPSAVPLKTRIGYGQNQPCNACDAVILPAQTEYGVEMPNGEHLRMHLGCHGLWLGELIRRSGHRPLP